MPNLNPAPDSRENLEKQLEIIRRDAVIDVLPYGTISMKREGRELAKMEETAELVCAFSDDGSGVQNDALMREAMLKAKSLGKLIAAHCEVNELLRGGYIHDGEYARAHGHKGICSESEWRQIERDLRLVRETGWAEADATPTHIVLQFSSSHGGAYVGTVGNTFWVDNVGLVY